MALLEFTIEKVEATATPKFVLFESAEAESDEDRDFETSISQPETSVHGPGILFVLAGLALVAWLVRRWL